MGKRISEWISISQGADRYGVSYTSAIKISKANGVRMRVMAGAPTKLWGPDVDAVVATAIKGKGLVDREAMVTA